jgi:hypothetical protein
MSGEPAIRKSGSQRIRPDLHRSAARCQVVADKIYDGIVQELSAVAFSLGASARCQDLSDDDRGLLTARAQTIQQCSLLLCGVAERLMSLDNAQLVHASDESASASSTDEAGPPRDRGHGAAPTRGPSL